MKKQTDKKRDLEKRLLFKSETLRRLDLEAVTGGDGGCTEAASCPLDSCGCTGTYDLPR